MKKKLDKKAILTSKPPDNKLMKPKHNKSTEPILDMKAMPTKIERIKKSAIEIISTKGYIHTSVAEIALNANVSVGYLYRHYISKQELINDIIVDIYKTVLQNIETILKDNNNVEDICGEIIMYHYKIYKTEPEMIRFLLMLINDYSTDTTEQQRKYLTDISNIFYKSFITKSGVREDVKLEEVYAALITVPMQSYALRLRGFQIDNIDEEETNIEIIKNISLRILK